MASRHFDIQMISVHLFSTDLENEMVIFSATWIYVKCSKLLQQRLQLIKVQGIFNILRKKLLKLTRQAAYLRGPTLSMLAFQICMAKITAS